MTSAELAHLQVEFPQRSRVQVRDWPGEWFVYSWTVDGDLIVRRKMVLDSRGHIVVPPDLVAVPARWCTPLQVAAW